MMQSFRLLSSSALGTCALLAAGLAAAPALAQENQDPAAVDAAADLTGAEAGQDEMLEEPAPEATMIVTGSRIRRPNLESQVPVTSIGGEEFFQQAQNSVGDTLNDLPQLRSTFAQQNPGAGVGIAGLNLLDLRGLGTVRTLVLVNGRRHVPADILNNASSPDVNTIPNDLIERVDVVTGGNSAVYGSDAIAGVVNFILRRNFEGIQVRGQAAISEEGFGASQYVSVMGGMNFADGRGNITAHVEFAHSDRIFGSDIPSFRRFDAFVTADVDSGGLPSASDGFPDAIFITDFRTGTIHRNGLAFVPQSQTGTRPCGQGTLANNGPPNTAGTAFHCNFIFTDDGRLTPQTGTRFGAGPTGAFVGGNGQNSREGRNVSVLPFMERVNANLIAHYEFSEALEVFAEAKVVRIDTVGNNVGPVFLQNGPTSIGNDTRLNPRLDNPFLNAADRTTLQNAILASGCGFNFGQSVTTTCRPLTAAELTAIADGSYRFMFARNLNDLTERNEFFQRDTFRVVGGLRGVFNGDWNYELSGSYGEFNETADLKGYIDRQRFLLSLDAGRNPVTGQIQCRSQFDPAARVGSALFTNGPARLAADIAACVPYNAFGDGRDNEAAARYVRADILNRASIDQLNFVGYLNGDSSQVFELPGGPVRFVIGAEYRREQAYNNSDEAADTLRTNGVFLGDVLDAPPLEVKEAFGELQIPLLRDTPFFEELTLSGAVRVSEYSNAVGTTLAYNAGIEWSPIRDIRLRANYGRAVRAPNVSESGFPNVPNFANGFVDPCNVNAIGQNPIRTVNCQAQLTPAQIAGLNSGTGGYSLPVISGSNPNLSEETADSYTIGGVIQPRFLPGLSLTVDYYDITVNDVIIALAAQAIVNGCYDTPGLTSPLCNSFRRNLTGGIGPTGEPSGAILANTLVQGPQNFAKLTRRGVDVELAYRTDIGSDSRLSTRLIYTHALQSSNFLNPNNPNFENRIMSELGDPQDEFRWNVDFTLGTITLGYEMRYIGPQLVGIFENTNPLNGQPPLNLDGTDILEYPAVLYHDLRFDFRIGGGGEGRSELSFTVGVDNVTDQEPPLGSTATGGGSAIWSIRGRSYYAGFRARF